MAEESELVMPVPVAAGEVILAAGFGGVEADPLAFAAAGGLAFTLELPGRLADPGWDAGLEAVTLPAACADGEDPAVACVATGFCAGLLAEGTGNAPGFVPG